MDQYQFALGHNHAVLTLVAVAGQAAGLVAPQPPVTAVVEAVLVAGHERTGMIAPTLRKHTSAVDDTIVAVQLAELGEVACRRIDV